MTSILPLEQRGCFIGGLAKSGSTLLLALLDNHPELLVLPAETEYFPTVLKKYGPRGRRAQFDYITQQSRMRSLFGAPAKPGHHDYVGFPKQEFLKVFETKVFGPATADRDLLLLMIESYAAVLSIPLERVKRWVEKTPANRSYIPQILRHFPGAKIILTMRDPRAILAAQLALKRKRPERRFSAYYMLAHWREIADLTLRAQRRELVAFTVQYEKLAIDAAAEMKKVCDFLEITFTPTMLQPTRGGVPWKGNSASATDFSDVSSEPVDRWQGQLSQDQIGWVEWHCRDIMPQFGYEPRLGHRSLRHWVKPIVGEGFSEYLRSRFKSLRGS